MPRQRSSASPSHSRDAASPQRHRTVATVYPQTYPRNNLLSDQRSGTEAVSKPAHKAAVTGGLPSQTLAGVTSTYTYPATSNKLTSVNSTPARALTYDGAGNILTDSRTGGPFTFAYNKANRLKTVTVAATVRGTYTYNGFEQLISRVITNSGTANGTTYFVHDIYGNIIAELTTAGATVREYIYLPETEIAPTRQSRTQVDLPVAVVDAVNTVTPALLMVHVDQLNRPVRMTNAAKASVWDVVYTPWGAPHTLTGAQTLNARFPGQWFQLESGLHYNWHRHYDPSLGRYTQPDPLGFVDGPSVYAYAKGSPQGYVDALGLASPGPGPSASGNGNTSGVFERQDGVCSVPTFVGRSMNRNPAIAACCKKHDECFTQNKCNSSSWGAPTYSNWSHKQCSPCRKCNDDVVQCVKDAVF